jgi:hypothetical protein
MTDMSARHEPASALTPAMINPFDCCDEDGEIVPPMRSEIVNTRHSQLDPATPIFRTAKDKEAFVATLPTEIQLQLRQDFGEDNLNQCFYVQKSGQQTLLLLHGSGHMTSRVRNKLERALPAARQLWLLFGEDAPGRRFLKHARFPI